MGRPCGSRRLPPRRHANSISRVRQALDDFNPDFVLIWGATINTKTSIAGSRVRHRLCL